MVKRATITVPEDLAESLDAYRRDQEVQPAFTSIVQAALREFLTGRGYLAPAQPFRLSRAVHGSGHADVSVEHDRYIAER